MKTCPNPKCKATDIPDDAQFCPKCGENLLSTEKAWDKQYISDKKNRDDLVQKKQLVELFEERRKHFFEVVSHNKAFILEKNNYINNCNNIHKKKIVYFILGVFCILLLGGVYSTIIFEDDVPFRDISSGGWGWALAILYPFAFFGVIVFFSSFKNTKVDETKIPPVAKAFIAENFKIYQLINPQTFDSEYRIWEQEVSNFATVTYAITNYKKMINQSIKNYDEQLRTIEQLR